MAGRKNDREVAWLLNNQLADERSKEIVMGLLASSLKEDEKVLAELRRAKVNDLVVEWECRVYALREVLRRGEKATVRLTPKQVRTRLGL